MRNRLIIAILLILPLLGFTPITSIGQTTSPPADVQSAIKDRTDKLNQLNQEIQATQRTLNNVQQQKKSLQGEVKTLDTSIQVLDLNIKTDAVTNEKLGYEIGSLQDELQKTGEMIQSKRDTVAKLLKELQKTDDQSVFVMIFGNQSLAQTLQDAQSIENLRSQLSIDMVKLNDLSSQYRDKLGIVSSKKDEVQLHQENLKNRAAIVADQKLAKQTILEETKNQESVYQQKIADLKAQQDKLQDEITQIENKLGQNFNTNVLPNKRSGVLAWPVTPHIITQRFGEHSSLYHGKPHNGMDIGVPIGTPVFAADDGVVMSADNNDQSTFQKYQYGKYVLIHHPNNLVTIYGHLSRQVVATGETVKRGQLIGYSGSTGYATGPHLHFGLYWGPTVSLKKIPPAAGLVPVGVVLDPADYL
jgi:murein DD-endopeptidase MepM/ murein hydrolase activator NlpD